MEYRPRRGKLLLGPLSAEIGDIIRIVLGPLGQETTNFTHRALRACVAETVATDAAAMMNVRQKLNLTAPGPGLPREL